ncbi:MAG: acylphosphatase [Planctomycetota bacterium]|jgi:acylphosphatase
MAPDQEDMARARVVIGGRVQGVWFRGTTYDQACGLGLTGWVRNRRDGKVEAVFEGPRSNVRQMVAWCHHGPRLARVESVDVEWAEATGEFDRFSVTY